MKNQETNWSYLITIYYKKLLSIILIESYKWVEVAHKLFYCGDSRQDWQIQSTNFTLLSFLRPWLPSTDRTENCDPLLNSICAKHFQGNCSFVKSLEMDLLLLLCGTLLGVLEWALLYISGRILHWSCLDLGFFG